MLDELYKNAVVSISNRYEGPPAIKVAKDVFAAMEKSGWHKARLVDASGTPQNEANRPQTGFEMRAGTGDQGRQALLRRGLGLEREPHAPRRDHRAGRVEEVRRATV